MLYGSVLGRHGNPEPQGLHNAKEFLDYLKQEHPEAKIFPDAKNPKIIHIEEGSLATEKNYVLDKPISIEFNGSLLALTKLVYQQSNDEIERPPSPPLGPAAGVLDDKTMVAIHAKNTTYRSVYTDGVPLDTYCHLLWVATVTREKERDITQVLYQGPLTTSATRPASTNADSQSN